MAKKVKSAKAKAASTKFPELIYVREERSDIGLDPYFEVHETPPVNSEEWDNFAIYKRIGSGRGRLVPEVIEDGKPHGRVRVKVTG